MEARDISMRNRWKFNWNWRRRKKRGKSLSCPVGTINILSANYSAINYLPQNTTHKRRTILLLLLLPLLSRIQREWAKKSSRNTIKAPLNADSWFNFFFSLSVRCSVILFALDVSISYRQIKWAFFMRFSCVSLTWNEQQKKKRSNIMPSDRGVIC